MTTNVEEVLMLFYSAVNHGNFEDVEELVNRYGLSYSPELNNGFALLLNAALFGFKNIVKFLLEKGVITNRNISRGDTPLHFAAWFGDLELVRLLLDHKALIDAKDHQFETPLHLACLRRHENIVELLLDRGANPNAIREILADHKDKFAHVKIGEAAFAAACGKGYEGFKEILDYGVQIDNSKNHKLFHSWPERKPAEQDIARENNVDQISENEGNVTPLHLAAESGPLKILELLLNKDAGINALTTEDSTPLFLATANEHVDVVAMLLEQGASVDLKDDNGRSPLLCAVRKKNSHLVRCILQHQPDTNEVHEIVINILTAANDTYREMLDNFVEYFVPLPEKVNCFSLLQAAVRKGYIKMINCLLNHGARVPESEEDLTLLHLAVESGDKETILLVLNLGYNINVEDKFGEAPVSYSMNSSRKDKHLETLLLLLDRGADLKKAPYLLHKAASQLDIEVCKILVKNSAEVNTLDRNGMAPLHRAASGQFHFFEDPDPEAGVEVTEFLLRSGADVAMKTNDGRTALHLAVSSGRDRIIHTLLNHGADVNSSPSDDTTPLQLACVQGNSEIAKVLLENGAYTEAVKASSFGPLHLAVLAGHEDIVRLLLDFHADVDAQGVAKETALHCAVLKKDLQLVKCLFENWCDVNIVNGGRRTAQDLAIENHNPFLTLDYNHDEVDIITRDVAEDANGSNAIKRAIKEHIIKLRSSDLHVSRQNLRQLDYLRIFPGIVHIQSGCYVENLRLKKLGKECILPRNLAKSSYPRHERDKSLVRELEGFNYEDFPYYGSLLRCSYFHSKARLEMITEGAKWLIFLMKTSNTLNMNYLAIPPTEMMEELLSYLSKRDLSSLICSGKKLKRQIGRLRVSRETCANQSSSVARCSKKPRVNEG